MSDTNDMRRDFEAWHGGIYAGRQNEIAEASWKAATERATPGWFPIETAPKDDTAILVMRDIWPGTKSGRAEECNAHNTYVVVWWGDENKHQGAWVCYMDAVLDPHCPIEPTHWMPLPPPPSIRQGGAHD